MEFVIIILLIGNKRWNMQDERYKTAGWLRHWSHLWFTIGENCEQLILQHNKNQPCLPWLMLCCIGLRRKVFCLLRSIGRLRNVSGLLVCAELLWKIDYRERFGFKCVNWKKCEVLYSVWSSREMFNATLTFFVAGFCECWLFNAFLMHQY